MTLGEIRYLDRAVYLPDSDALVLADVHLGRGRSDTVAAPVDTILELENRVRRLCERFRPAQVVIAGDLLDAFDGVPPRVVERTEAILDAVVAADARPILVAGNHDGMLATVTDEPVHEEYVLEGTVVCHGHASPEATGDRYVIGHEHPALRIEGVKRPCYLVGEEAYEGASVVVLPAFSPLLQGTAFNRQSATDCDSPVLRSVPIRECRPIVRDESDDETLTFPALGRMSAFL